MLEKHKQDFMTMTAEETRFAAESLNHPDMVQAGLDNIEGPQDFWDACVNCGVGHADLVMSMSTKSEPIAVVCLEKLIGHPLRREPPETQTTRTQQKSKGPRKQVSRAQTDDSRKITKVAPNPKKNGSKSWERYNHYEVGITVAEFIKRGGTRGDVTHDIARGFIEVDG